MLINYLIQTMTFKSGYILDERDCQCSLEVNVPNRLSEALEIEKHCKYV